MIIKLGRTQYNASCGYDEPFQIPTEFSAELAVRTQQVIAYESGIARTVDPLGGSYFLEQHTDRMEDMITKVMDEMFSLDPTVAQRALDKFQRLLDTRQQSAVDGALAKLFTAAAKDRENVMPYLVDCCHAYATVGEMVSCLKKQWGEFKEPVSL